MNDETTNAPNPIGLYHDMASNTFVGALDPIQADAMVHTGFVLHTEGREAAMTKQEDIEALKNLGKTPAAPVEPASDNKKGK